MLFKISNPLYNKKKEKTDSKKYSIGDIIKLNSNIAMASLNPFAFYIFIEIKFVSFNIKLYHNYYLI